MRLVWLVVLRINVDLAIFQPYLDLEAGDYQSLKIQVARPGIEPRSSCSASQELNHSATAAPIFKWAFATAAAYKRRNLLLQDSRSDPVRLGRSYTMFLIVSCFDTHILHSRSQKVNNNFLITNSCLLSGTQDHHVKYKRKRKRYDSVLWKSTYTKRK